MTLPFLRSLLPTLRATASSFSLMPGAAAVAVDGATARDVRGLNVQARTIACRGLAVGVRNSELRGTDEASAGSIDAAAWGFGSTAVGVDGSQIRLRGGDDGLTVRATVGCGGQAIAARDSIIGLGDDGDRLRLEARGGRDPLSGQRVEIFGGDGDDSIELTAGGEDLFIRTGSGDDYFVIGGDVTATGRFRSSSGLPALIAGDEGYDVLKLPNLSAATWASSARRFEDEAGGGYLAFGTQFRYFELGVFAGGVEVVL